MSPYAYTWNDPVNYTDPTGMMGERIGEPGGPNTNKVYDGGVIEEIVLKGKKLNWLQRVGRFLGLGNSPSRNATAGTIPTMSQAPSGRTHNTLGQWTQAYRDYQPSSTDMFGQVMKPIIDGGLDAANLLRNVNPISDKRDYNGLATRMTKWDGNTMGAQEGQNSSFNGIMFMGSFMVGGLKSSSGEITISRGTNNFLENEIANETGYIMSDAARNAYIEAMYSGVSQSEAVNIALKASQKAHVDNIAHFGSLKNYMDAHTLLGTEINGAAPRSMISFSTNESVISNFGKNTYKTTTNNFKKQTIGGESEVFIFHMIKIKK